MRITALLPYRNPHPEDPTPVMTEDGYVQLISHDVMLQILNEYDWGQLYTKTKRKNARTYMKPHGRIQQ